MPAFTDALGTDGAIVRVEVGVSHAQLLQLRVARRPIPQPTLLSALIDPGAEITCIDTRAARILPLPLSRTFRPVNAPALSGLSYVISYEIGLTVLHPSGNLADNLVVDGLPVAELALGVFHIDLLL